MSHSVWATSTELTEVFALQMTFSTVFSETKFGVKYILCRFMVVNSETD